jgi:hypothetical protein
LAGGAGTYVPWPKSLTDYLEKELQSEFELRYFVLDRAQFNDDLVAVDGYEPAALVGDLSSGAILKSWCASTVLMLSGTCLIQPLSRKVREGVPRISLSV